MRKKFWIYISIACVLLLTFVALTVALVCVDVQKAGESQAPVGFATLNEAVFDTLGQNEFDRKMSELFGALMIAAVGAFGVLGLVQVIRRKGILRADRELYFMAGGLVLLAAAYVLFEVLVINYRPVLEDGAPAASYPSSHTMLAVAVAGMGAICLLCRRKPGIWHGLLSAALIGLACVTVALRLLGGVHWLTDIVGGLLLGGVIVAAYGAACALWGRKKEQGNEG